MPESQQLQRSPIVVAAAPVIKPTFSLGLNPGRIIRLWFKHFWSEVSVVSPSVVRPAYRSLLFKRFGSLSAISSGTSIVACGFVLGKLIRRRRLIVSVFLAPLTFAPSVAAPPSLRFQAQVAPLLSIW
jgi:hypothetical protein